MIIEPSAAVKGLQDGSVPVRRILSRTYDLPPAYAINQSSSSSTRQADVESILSHSGSSSDLLSPADESKRMKQKRKRRKRIVIFVVALAVYSAALVALVVEKPWKKKHSSGSIYIPPNGPWIPVLNVTNSGGGTISSGSSGGSGPGHMGAVISCTAWDHITPESSRMQSLFPYNTSEIFINNMAGSWIGGTLHVYEAPSGGHPLPGYLVQVEARPRFQMGDVVQKNIDVCILGGSQFGSLGIGVYNVKNPSQADIDVNINLIVPRNMTLPNFTTYLPGFKQVIGPPSQTAPKLSNISLNGPSSALQMNAGEAQNICINTASAFEGTLTVSQSLTIRSPSSSLSPNVTLVYRGQPLLVDLETGSAPIQSFIRIQNLGDDSSSSLLGVVCNITAKTNHAPIALDVAYTSPRVVLNVDAETAMAPLTVSLPPAFEGTFDIQAGRSQAALREFDVKDPLNENRTRLVSFSSPNRTESVTGAIVWVKDDPIDVGLQPHDPPPTPNTSRSVVGREDVDVNAGEGGAGHVRGHTQSAKAWLELGNDASLWEQSDRWPSGCAAGGG